MLLLCYSTINTISTFVSFLNEHSLWIKVFNKMDTRQKRRIMCANHICDNCDRGIRWGWIEKMAREEHCEAILSQIKREDICDPIFWGGNDARRWYVSITLPCPYCKADLDPILRIEDTNDPG